MQFSLPLVAWGAVRSTGGDSVIDDSLFIVVPISFFYWGGGGSVAHNFLNRFKIFANHLHRFATHVRESQRLFQDRFATQSRMHVASCRRTVASQWDSGLTD